MRRPITMGRHNAKDRLEAIAQKTPPLAPYLDRDFLLIHAFLTLDSSFGLAELAYEADDPRT
jgi:hypothetical protein